MADRQASPTACVIDSQSVKSAEKGGARIDPKGYDAGKKISGKKRHILVDTEGLLIALCRHPGPRWRGVGSGNVVWPLPILAEAFR
jgi:hypothetical protein